MSADSVDCSDSVDDSGLNGRVCEFPSTIDDSGFGGGSSGTDSKLGISESSSDSDSVVEAGLAGGTSTCIDPWPDSDGAVLEGGRTADDDSGSSGSSSSSGSSGSSSPHHVPNLSNSFSIFSNSNPSPRFPNTVITSFGTCTISTL